MITDHGIERAIKLSKVELRRTIKATIASMSAGDRRAQESALAGRFRDLPGLAGASTILLFVPALPEEPPTTELFALAYRTGKTILCPRVNRRERRLSLHRIADPATELGPGILGIPEPRPDLPEVAPAVVDWALVPGIAFDLRGHRLGRGAGYYDRLLPCLRPDATCWAICLSCQLVPELPVEPHDAPLNGVSTPERDIRGVRESGSGQRGWIGGQDE